MAGAGKEPGSQAGGFRGWFFGQPYLLLTLTTLMWSGNAVASRLAVGEVSPMTLTFVRWAAVCAALAILVRDQVIAAWPALRPRWPSILWMGALGFTAFNAMFYVAGHHTTAVNIALIQGSIPVLVLAGALAIFGTPVGAVQAIGVAVTLAGVAVVASQGDLAALAALAINFGDLLMLIAAAFYAAYTLGLRNRPAVPGLAFFTALAFVALVTSAPLFLIEWARGDTVWPTAKGLAILAYVAIGPSLLAQLFFMRGVELIGPGRAGVFVNLVPVFGPFMAVAILGEPFLAYHALALALVVGGIFLAERFKP
ncbi:MAG TPA: DMT family transporter, partial [Beijerinckiaceae bacterium]|nr:DMT family transporter [Beijerinckiaceae bacterium]